MKTSRSRKWNSAKALTLGKYLTWTHLIPKSLPWKNNNNNNNAHVCVHNRSTMCGFYWFALHIYLTFYRLKHFGLCLDSSVWLGDECVWIFAVVYNHHIVSNRIESVEFMVRNFMWLLSCEQRNANLLFYHINIEFYWGHSWQLLT